MEKLIDLLYEIRYLLIQFVIGRMTVISNATINVCGPEPVLVFGRQDKVLIYNTTFRECGRGEATNDQSRD